MTNKGFSSPREEALETAHHTRKNILTGNGDAVSVLRGCLVIASCLNKDRDTIWIDGELSGYNTTNNLPEYRVVPCRYTVSGKTQDDFFNVRLTYPVHSFTQLVKRNEAMYTVEDDGKVVTVSVPKMENILARITDKCLFFLNTVITELQYGGVVEYLMEEIRRSTDEKLATLDNKISDETHSLFLNLTSTNPADWSKVGHSCRKVLKFLADRVFPPSGEKYTAKDCRVLEIDDSHFINRLCAFLDQKSSGDELKFLKAEIEYLESYLRQTVNYAQLVEHNPSIAKFHANMLAIHTYLISSEILRHV